MVSGLCWAAGAGADDLARAIMDVGRLARESQVLLAAGALLAVGFLRDQVSVLVLMAAVAWCLYLSWRAVHAEDLP